jgi:hypothetical protein
MPIAIQLFADLDGGKFVQSSINTGAYSFSTLKQNDVIPVTLKLMQKNTAGGFTSPYTVLTDQQTVRIGVVTPSATAPSIYALSTLTWQPATYTYTGTLAMTAAEVATLLGSGLSASATFEMEAQGGNAVYSIQTPVTVVADGLKVGTPINLTGTQSFLDIDQSDARYLKRTSDMLTAPAVYAITTAGSMGISAQGQFFAFKGVDGDDTVAVQGDVVLKSGGTYTGQAHLAAPNHPNAAARHGYVLALDGGTLTGPVHAPAPVHPNQVATRQYVLDNAGTPQVGEGLRIDSAILKADYGLTGTNVSAGNHNHNTGTLVETGAGLFHTSQRVRDVSLTGVDIITQGAVAAADTVLTGLGKLQATKLSVEGGTMTGQLLADYGSDSLPGIAFDGDTNTGIYRVNNDRLGFVAGATTTFEISNSWMAVHKLTTFGPLTDSPCIRLSGPSTMTSNYLEVSDYDENQLFDISRYGGVSVSNTGLAGASEKGVKVTSSSATGNSKLTLINSAGGNGANIRLEGASVTTWGNQMVIENAITGKGIVFKTDATETARIEADKVGIGITTALAKLHVRSFDDTNAGILLENMEVGPVLELRSAYDSGETALKITNDGGGATGLKISNHGHINMTSAAAPLTPANGDLYHEGTTQKVLKQQVAGNVTSLPGVLLTGISDATVANTPAETSLLPTYVGAGTLAANTLVAGKMLQYRATGIFSSKASPVGDITLRAKIGGKIVGLAVLTPADNVGATDSIWTFTGQVTCRTTGATGAYSGLGVVGFFKSSATGFVYDSAKGVDSTLNTIVVNKFDLTAQWGTADGDNSITLVDLSVEILN